MTEQGRIIKTEGNIATVRLLRSSACGNCGMCGMTEEQKHIDIDLPNSLKAVEGDTVKIEINEKASFKATLIVYLIPLAVAIVGMLVGYLCGLVDWILAIIFIVGLSGGFTAVRLIDKKYSKKLDLIPKMIEIIKENNNE